MQKYLDETGLAHFWDNIQGQIGSASDQQVADWLDAHPEATTTVQDGAVTTAKLADNAVTFGKLDETLQDSITSDNLLHGTLFPYKEEGRRISINGVCPIENYNFMIMRPHGAGTLNRTSDARTMLYFMPTDLAGLEVETTYTLSFDLTYSMFKASESSSRYINVYLYENKGGAHIDTATLRTLSATSSGVTLKKQLAQVTQANKEVEHTLKGCTFEFALESDTTSFVLFLAGSATSSSAYHMGNYMWMDNMRLVRGSDRSWAPSLYDTGNTIVNRNPGMLEKLEQLNRPTRTGSRTLGTAPFCLLHFSDIHGDKYCLENVIEFYRHYSDYIDDVLHTGDSVMDYAADGMTFWSGTDGAEYIMNCIGNHDTRVSTDWTSLDMSTSYSTYLAPYIANWDVQYTSGKTYYYKDYADKNVRLIVLDVIHQTADQLTWFESTLSGARINGYHVIAALHARASWNFDPYNVTWDDRHVSAHYTNNWSDTSSSSGTSFPSNLSDDYADAVDAFMAAGGYFVCWLHGHQHHKMFAALHDHPNQLDVCVSNAGGTDYAWTYVWARIPWTKSMDDFNLVAVDVESKVLRLAKVGVDYDRFMRHVDSISYNYDTHELLYANA